MEQFPSEEEKFQRKCILTQISLQKKVLRAFDFTNLMTLLE
jgi:hypothetical protein